MPWNIERKNYMQNKHNVKMIDPPSGWMYGFPKVIPNDVTDVNKWLVENGYPQAQVDKFSNQLPCRFWYDDGDV